MMKLMPLLAVSLAFAAGSALAAPAPLLPLPAAPEVAPMSVAQSWSCNPRKTCGRINSCQEAIWYHRNCSWGGRLDGDNDGIPCESLCR